MGSAASAPASKKAPAKKAASAHDQQEFEVERIMEYDPAKEKCYKIRWRGYSPSDDTWEGPENLEGCTLALHEFWKAKHAAAAAASAPVAQAQARTNSSSSKQTSSGLGVPPSPKVSGGVRKRKKTPKRG